MRKFYVRYEYNWHTHAGPGYGNTTIAVWAIARLIRRHRNIFKI